MSSNVKKFLSINLVVTLTLGIILGVTLLGVAALKAHAGEGAAAAVAPAREALPAGVTEAAFWSAALAVVGSCLAAGIAVGMTGSAAIGAISERPELMGRTILFVGLAEGIAIYGLVIAIIILFRVG